MARMLGRIVGGLSLGMAGVVSVSAPGWANELFVAYPPAQHETVADQIFLIGTADPDAEVRVNGQVIENRSPAGHFAPSLPLEMGENQFTLTQGGETLVITVTRVDNAPAAPVGTAFADGSLEPGVDVARLPDDLICFSAIAPPQAAVSVRVGQATLPLEPQSQITELPPNYAVLTQTNEPQQIPVSEQYRGCTTGSDLLGSPFVPLGNPSGNLLSDSSNNSSGAIAPGMASGMAPGMTTGTVDLGYPQFQLSLNGEIVTETGPGTIQILAPNRFEVAEVTAASGTARTGPSTSYSRLTPLPPGTRAVVTGREGEWLRLDYGAWIRASETRIVNSAVPPRSIIRSVTSRQVPGWTEVVFPLQVPVPVTVDQRDRTLTLTLHNTTAQTDTIYFSNDPAVQRMDWQPGVTQAPSYTFHFHHDQQWGYKLRYEGTSLILSLKHPPAIAPQADSALAGMKILLDPGHGSDNDLGARGPTGYPEKDVNLTVSKLLRDELEARGATVYMTREGDDDLYPQDRVDMINAWEPDVALSVHYNALPDNGDALNTAGIGMFWYHPQAHSLAAFLHDYLVETLDRPAYGVYWNNLALTRPAIAPSVLLELGFMINPTEFEWIVDPEAQVELVTALADGLELWVESATAANP